MLGIPGVMVRGRKALAGIEICDNLCVLLGQGSVQPVVSGISITTAVAVPSHNTAASSSDSGISTWKCPRHFLGLPVMPPLREVVFALALAGRGHANYLPPVGQVSSVPRQLLFEIAPAS